MEYDDKRASEKLDEMYEIMTNVILDYCSLTDNPTNYNDIKYLATNLVKEFVTIRPPEKKTISFELLTISSGGKGGGTSLKPGNMILNMRKLFKTIASGVLAIPGIVHAPWTIPFFALLLWDNIWSSLKINFSERDAAIIWTLWFHRDSYNRVQKKGLLEKVNSELTNYERTLMSTQELEDSLDKLCSTKCIVDNDKQWWLREWVRVIYR